MKEGREAVVDASLKALKETQTTYAERINTSKGLDLRGRQELLGVLLREMKDLERAFYENRFHFEPEENEFFRVATPELVRQFAALLSEYLGPELR